MRKLSTAIEKVDSADLVLIGVKLWDTEAIAASLAPLAKTGAAILSLQNGVQKDDVLRRHLPSNAVMGGICYIAAAIAEPGVIVHTGAMQRLVFGEYGGARSDRGVRFLAALTEAGVDGEFSDAIERLIWEKFVFLVGLSGTTSLLRKPIGPILADEKGRALLLAAMQEVVAVGRAKGVPLPADFAAGRLAFCDTLPFGMTTSMQTDLERGNRLELPWLSGSVVTMGAELGIPTPANIEITQALTPFVAGRR